MSGNKTKTYTYGQIQEAIQGFRSDHRELYAETMVVGLGVNPVLPLTIVKQIGELEARMDKKAKDLPADEGTLGEFKIFQQLTGEYEGKSNRPDSGLLDKLDM